MLLGCIILAVINNWLIRSLLRPVENSVRQQKELLRSRARAKDAASIDPCWAGGAAKAHSFFSGNFRRVLCNAKRGAADESLGTRFIASGKFR